MEEISPKIELKDKEVEHKREPKNLIKKTMKWED